MISTDLSGTIAPKSDQLNADDLILGARTVKITRVEVQERSNKPGDQPVSIFFDGDNGKPYKPGLSMRRVLIQAWGAKGETYAGRSMTLFRDVKVSWGGAEVGGIRISHMSHIDQPLLLSLTASKTSRKPYRVDVLVVAGAPSPAPAKDKPTKEQRQANAKSKANAIIAELMAATDVQAVLTKHGDTMARLDAVDTSLVATIIEAGESRLKALAHIDQPLKDDAKPAAAGSVDDELLLQAARSMPAWNGRDDDRVDARKKMLAHCRTAKKELGEEAYLRLVLVAKWRLGEPTDEGDAAAQKEIVDRAKAAGWVNP